MPPDVIGPGGGNDDAAWVADWTTRAWRRWRGLGLLHAITWGLGLALLVGAVLPGRLGVLAAGATVVLAAGVTWVRPRFRELRVLLLAAERERPALRNALMAWTEARDTLTPAITRRLAAQARTGLEAAPAPQPYGRAGWLAAATVLAAGLAAPALVARWPAPAGVARTGSGREASGPAVVGGPAVDWTVTVTPPAYTGRAPERSRRATRVDVLAGSRVELALTHWPAAARVSIGDAVVPLRVAGENGQVAFTATASDVLLLRASGGEMLGSIALVVRPDAPPATRIVAPGADLHRDAAEGLVPIRITAQDDLGLRDLRLRFTKVSGSGESFSFEDGEWPVRVTRTSATQWVGTYALDLARLGLAPGDSVAYHAVAHDARPGADGAAESERFLIQITKPGEATGGEYSLPEPEERFALSQRMVIQLTERLLEKRPRLSASEYRAEAQALAMAQRRVRAEFVFMLGGEVEDEVAEAEHSHEVEAGRLDNRGQGELTEAVRQMAQAERRLTDADLREALPYEYRALAAVQAAFGKARYFMRTLPAPVQIDPARRLQGDRATASSARWTDAPLPEDQRVAGLALLRRLEALGPGDAQGRAALMPALVALERGNPVWVALVQRMHDGRQAPEVARALRTRLAESAIHWRPVPLPASEGEARLPAGAGRPR